MNAPTPNIIQTWRFLLKLALTATSATGMVKTWLIGLQPFAVVMFLAAVWTAYRYRD